MRQDGGPLADLDVAHDRGPEADRGAPADHHRGDDEAPAAPVVGEDPDAAPDRGVVAQGDELRVRDVLGVHERVAADLHPHRLQEPDPEGGEGHEGQEGVADQVEERVVDEPRQDVDRVVAALEGADPGRQRPVVGRHHDEQRQPCEEEAQRGARGRAEEGERPREPVAPRGEVAERPQRRGERQPERRRRDDVHQEHRHEVGRPREAAQETVEGVAWAEGSGTGPRRRDAGPERAWDWASRAGPSGWPRL